MRVSCSLRCSAAGLVLALAVLTARPAAADEAPQRPPNKSRWSWYWETRPASAYKLHPALDIGIGLVSIPTWTVQGLEGQLPGPSCGQPMNPCDPNTVPGFDRPYIYNNESLRPAANAIFWGTIPVLGAVMFLDYGPRQWKSYLTDMVIAFESYTLSAALTYIVRITTRRPRPFLYIEGARPDARDSAGATHSFWSGHVAYMAAFTSSLAYLTVMRHGWRSPWTWIMVGAAVGVGASSATLAVLTGNHFLSDALVGLATGTGVGLLVPFVHPRNKKLPFNVSPVATRDTVGLTISGNL